MSVADILGLGGPYAVAGMLAWVANELRHVGRRIDLIETRVIALEKGG